MATSKKKFIPEGVLVEIDWADAWASDYDTEDHQAVPLRRVGYVLLHNEDGIKVAGQKPLDEQSQHRGIIFIPGYNIISINVVKSL